MIASNADHLVQRCGKGNSVLISSTGLIKCSNCNEKYVFLSKPLCRTQHGRLLTHAQITFRCKYGSEANRAATSGQQSVATSIVLCEPLSWVDNAKLSDPGKLKRKLLLLYVCDVVIE